LDCAKRGEAGNEDGDGERGEGHSVAGRISGSSLGPKATTHPCRWRGPSGVWMPPHWRVSFRGTPINSIAVPHEAVSLETSSPSLRPKHLTPAIRCYPHARMQYRKVVCIGRLFPFEGWMMVPILLQAPLPRSALLVPNWSISTFLPALDVGAGNQNSCISVPFKFGVVSDCPLDGRKRKGENRGRNIFFMMSFISFRRVAAQKSHEILGASERLPSFICRAVPYSGLLTSALAALRRANPATFKIRR
jgi:hypothetical protein